MLYVDFKRILVSEYNEKQNPDESSINTFWL